MAKGIEGVGSPSSRRVEQPKQQEVQKPDQQQAPQRQSRVDQDQNVRNARGDSNFEDRKPGRSGMPNLMLKGGDDAPAPTETPVPSKDLRPTPDAAPTVPPPAQTPVPTQAPVPGTPVPATAPRNDPNPAPDAAPTVPPQTATATATPGPTAPVSNDTRPTAVAAPTVPPPPPPTIDGIVNTLKAGDTSDATRKMIGDYFTPLGMDDSKAAMDRIRQENLLPQFIDAAARDANGKPVTPEVKAAVQKVMETGKLDVYAETLSKTPITVGTFKDKDGNPALQYAGAKEGIQLDKDALAGKSDQDVANIMAHEMFHAFSDAHGGQGYTALDEGLGIAAREYAFSDKDYNLSEMVYGTKNFYRDYRKEPDYRLGDFSKADPKLKELTGAFSARDSSHLAWNDPKQFQSDYQQFWQAIPRNQDGWSEAADKATKDMLAARGT